MATKTTTLNLKRKRGAIKTVLGTIATTARVVDAELRLLEATNYLDNVNELVTEYGLTVAQAEAILQP